MYNSKFSLKKMFCFDSDEKSQVDKTVVPLTY